MDIPCPGPCGFHGISNEFKLQIHVLFHVDSMEESTSNSMENPLKGLSKMVSTSRIEQSTPQHINVCKDRAFLPLSHNPGPCHVGDLNLGHTYTLQPFEVL